MAQAGCILLLLVVVAVIIAPMVGGFAAAFVITVVLTLAALIAGYFYLKGDTKRQVARVLARIDAYNPEWHFDGPQQSSYMAIVTFRWSASTRVATEDGGLSASLTETITTTSTSSISHEANVHVSLDGKPLFAETFLGIVMNDYAIAFINSRIAAIAGQPAADPLTRCRAYLAEQAAERRRESELRRKFTGT